MPTIQFKGKNIIWNHHLSVPYHTLEEIEDLHFQPEKADGNIIVEGDNLIALKALLPQYAGKVKCIYIDPPYNTGDDNGVGKGWVYNDNVNSPLIKEWVKKEVGKDDLTKHDKWLCMLAPRLKLLRELMMDEGVVFISIDDHEIEHLKIICNEIFGEQNFVGQWNWFKSSTPPNLSKKIKKNIEYVLCYEKTKNDIRYKGKVTTSKSDDPLIKPQNSLKQLIFKKGELEVGLKDGTVKAGVYGTEKYPNKLLNDMIVKKGTNHNEVSFENTFIWLQEKLEEELENETIVKCSKNLVLSYKKANYQNQVPKNIIDSSVDVTTTEKAGKQLTELFGKKVFDYPKPVSLVKYLSSFCTDENDIILDSFAGSGTTMHAVNELNKEDGGNRKCILVQMTEESEQEPDKNIAKDITRERNKLAIEKYGYDTGFKYYRVGNAIDPDAMLDGELPDYAEFAKYVYYLGTGEHLSAVDKIDQTTHFVGTHGPKNFYLIYEQDFDTLSRLALNLHIAEEIIAHSKGKRIVVYAPACFLDNEYLEEKQIEYVSIPYNLFEKSEE